MKLLVKPLAILAIGALIPVFSAMLPFSGPVRVDTAGPRHSKLAQSAGSARGLLRSPLGALAPDQTTLASQHARGAAVATINKGMKIRDIWTRILPERASNGQQWQQMAGALRELTDRGQMGAPVATPDAKPPCSMHRALRPSQSPCPQPGGHHRSIGTTRRDEAGPHGESKPILNTMSLNTCARSSFD